MADTPKVTSLDDVQHWLDKLEKAQSVLSTTQWPIGGVLDHLSQSVEMSMDGFPQLKSALFQNTAGAAAFAVFKWRGQMSHDLLAPIPGAPALSTSTDWHAGVQRLRVAVQRFQRHSGALMPHFAYGQLSHRDFAIAHSLHIANHQDEITVT